MGYYVWNAENTGKMIYDSSHRSLDTKRVMKDIKDKYFKYGVNAGIVKAQKTIRNSLGL